VLGPQRAIAWRVLDAQYFGVAQRRRRVFVVASARDGFNPAEILFEFGGVRRDIAPSREAGKAVAPTAAGGTPFGRAGSWWDGGNVAATITTNSDNQRMPDKDNAQLVMCPTTDVFPTLLSSTAGVSRPGNAATEHETYIPMASPVHYRKSRRAQSTTDQETWVKDDVSNTLNCFDAGDIRSTDVVAQPVSCLHEAPIPAYALQGAGHTSQNSQGSGWNEEISFTLNCMDVHGVAQPIGIFQDSEFGVQKYESAGTLRAGRIPEHQMVMQPMLINTMVAPILTASNDPSRSPQSSEVTNQVAAVHAVSMAVRRLTPVECERLQGFPDGYTNIPWRKASESPDGPRYKALGNSWAVPVVRWIGSRIQESLK